MKLQQIPSGFRILPERVRERWEQLVESELEQMENHRRALLDVHQVRSQDLSEAVAQDILKNQPGLQ